ncbi:hypothetical protein ES319_A05G327800v1 [Gossypium barbadense]|uniref:DNA polymerase alpha subunit B n=3 Tax=Gossypium TaxID=3633 RepID=A0A5J5VWW6_GOSBA|nr:hypothetical protein ES319_A05G327800v1 [Gossypium barbadense]TYH19349.1 hypothetical protein ES288_A05G344900v1 [Gossypium darwinii]TYI29913.1 hypothetical protein ES332_A05G349600v1 [Gossypium tomentosum]
MEEEIKAEFLKSGFTLDEEQEILKKCHTFCQDYRLEPSDLVSSWEIYYLNRQLDESVVKDAEMDGFLGHLQNEQLGASAKKDPGLHMYSFKDVVMVLDAEDEDTKDVILGTPIDKYEKLQLDIYDSARKTNGNIYSSERKSKLVTPFGKRSNKFVVKFNIDNLPTIETANGIEEHYDLEDGIIKRVQPLKSSSLVVHQSGLEPGCRFMYDRIEDRFNAIENRIRKHAAALVASSLYEEPMDPSVASQRSMFAVGMICCDGEGHLNDKSILLQSSVEHSRGQRVRLELNKLSHFSVFPGQIVGIKGHNPSGHCLIASELVDSVPLSIAADADLPPTKKQALDEEIQATHLSSTPTETTMVQDYLEYMGPNAQLVMVPSIRDANHDFVFPQPAFDLDSLNVRLQITSLNNPGIFEADQVMIGCCTVDILKHLSGEEMSRHSMDGQPNDRLSRLASHILSQQSFYPLYPPAEGVPMDFSLASEVLHISSVPDLLILPSDIKYFVKVLPVGGTTEGEEEQMKRCVCINPGRLAKGEGGGTFVELKYQGSSDKMNASIISI